MEGRVILLTGANGSIGSGIAKRLADDGAKVYCADLALPEEQENTFWKIVNVTEDEAIKVWADQVGKENGGRIDGIVCCHAAFIWGTIEQASASDWDKVFSVNVRGYALVAKYAVPYMKEYGGSIVLISSQSAFIAQPQFTPYNTSKSAIEMMSKCLALDYGPFKIRSNTVCPGDILTKATAAHAKHIGKSMEQHTADTVNKLCLKRMGSVVEVANCVRFLLSDESSYVTGSSLHVDGGSLVQ